MKIGIYNLNMSGLGGGDKQTVALAEHLGKQNEVNLFTREPINIQKRKYILSAGRFIAFDPLLHHKRQDVIITEFIRMKELHSDGHELHPAGTINKHNDAAFEYAEHLRRSCEGYPVYFHFNASRAELVELYRSSTVQLHATGNGTKSQDSPHSQQYFGITTVEAMSAGCIPIVINSGGQPEIVTDGVNGFIWNDLEELKRGIRSITSDEASNLNR